MTVLQASEAVAAVNPQRWANADVSEKLQLLYRIRSNMAKEQNALLQAVAKDRNERSQTTNHSPESLGLAVCFGFANSLNACIDLYERLTRGKLRQPNRITKVSEGLYDVETYPQTLKERTLFPFTTMYIRCKGSEEPRVIHPTSQSPGIVGILAGGNTASSLEILKSLYFDNKVVVHKAHPINVESDKVWERILVPLEEVQAISYCDETQGPALCADPRLDRIYFTGSTAVAKQIEASSKTRAPLTAECGGVNPVVVVPGDRPWTDAEMEHQAMQIVTIGKYFGGAVCARPQVLVTCQHWPQREQFLAAMQRAIVEQTPAVASFYPGSSTVFDTFVQKHPDGIVLRPQESQEDACRVLFVPNVTDPQNAYCCKHEAFCQVFCEVPLDTKPLVDDFLPRAVDFSNKHLFGSLCATILVDGTTRRAHQETVNDAVTNLKYGVINVNGIAVMVWAMPHLTWGGCESEHDVLESGKGNFGNPFGYPNVEKSILHDAFVSPSHLMWHNKQIFDETVMGLTNVALEPSWWNHFAVVAAIVFGSLRKKDF